MGWWVNRRYVPCYRYRDNDRYRVTDTFRAYNKRPRHKEIHGPHSDRETDREVSAWQKQRLAGTHADDHRQTEVTVRYRVGFEDETNTEQTWHTHAHLPTHLRPSKLTHLDPSRPTNPDPSHFDPHPPTQIQLSRTRCILKRCMTRNAFIRNPPVNCVYTPEAIRVLSGVYYFVVFDRWAWSGNRRSRVQRRARSDRWQQVTINRPTSS